MSDVIKFVNQLVDETSPPEDTPRVEMQSGGLIQKDFIDLYEKFPGGSDLEFSKFIENETGIKLNPNAVNERRRRANLKIKLKEGQSLKGTATRLADNQVASEAKKLGIDTKGKTVKELRRKISSVRLREKRKTDPDARLKKAKLSKEYRRKITERRRTDPEFNIQERKKIRERRRRAQLKNPRVVAAVPHDMTPKGLLFKDLTTQALRNQKGMLPNSHIKFLNPDQVRPTGIAKAKQIQLIDTKVLDANGQPKIITYDNVTKHIDDNQKLYGINSKSVLAEYDKKITINKSGLRNKFNETIYGEAYKSATTRGKQSFAPFHVHHPAGRANNAFNVQFAVGSDNMRENGLRATLDSEFKAAKTFGDKRKAVKKYLNNVPKNLEVRLKRTPYGVRQTLTEVTERVSPELSKQLLRATPTGEVARDVAKKIAKSSGPTLGINLGFLPMLKTAGEVIGSPAAALAFATMTVKDNLEKGESLPAAVADKMVGLELLAPGAISRFAPGVMKGVLGLGRVARAFTPIGLGLTAAGAAKDVYREYKRREALSDEDRLQEDLEAQEKFDEIMVGAAKGGLIPPKSGKTPHGDKGLASLADYDMTNTEFINGRY